jgi:hypothetical protein
MSFTRCLDELRGTWFPHMTDSGLDRLTELLEQGSPLLVHGCFSRALPMGCLATHVAWHHPRTAHLTQDAGIHWLYRVAGLNPATSEVIRAWDRRGVHDWELRSTLIEACKEEQAARRERPEVPNRLALNKV